MCGIWALCFAHPSQDGEDYKAYQSLHHRGPDDSIWLGVEHYPLHYGFHRLAIQDTTEHGRQPFVRQDEKYYQAWMCNGEIYNAPELKKGMPLERWEGHSDCEVLGPWFLSFLKKNEFAMNHTIVRSMMDGLDGVYACIYFIWEHYSRSGYIFVCRDPIGVRPLFWGRNEKTGGLYFSSESRSIPLPGSSIHPFPAGSLWVCPVGKDVMGNISMRYSPRHKRPSLPSCFPDIPGSIGYYWGFPLYHTPQVIGASHHHLVELLEESVKKRLISDRPIGCLLSGGLDSSLIAALAARMMREQAISQSLHTFSIGFEGAPDLVAARAVAKWIGSEHTEIVITPEEALQAIPEVVKSLGTWDPTTIRASTGMYLAARYIKEKTPFRVILSGEGADELFQGYLYFHKAPTPEEGREEAHRLVEELLYYDVLRADRTTAAHGLELRVPFLDKELARYAMQIPVEKQSPTYEPYKVEKGYLREAIQVVYPDLLPREIVWRKKEAFSDGVSQERFSWFEMIQQHCQEIIKKNGMEMFDKLKPIPMVLHPLLNNEEERERQRGACSTQEALWFRWLYQQYYPRGGEHQVPHVWLPRWSRTTDPSARRLDSA
jgi:asparagine synthase (glutamine-hydrolysing)